MSEEYDGPSKSQLKREAEAKQALGVNLIDLSLSELEGLDLDLRLHEVIIAAQKMRNDSSLKRQKQLIGKLMRQLDDEEYGRIQLALDALTVGSERQKIVEKWVEDKVVRLLAKDDSVNEEILAQLQDVDFQYIRQLARNAVKELEKNQKSRSRTLLFRYLRGRF